MEDVLTEIPPPSRFFQEELNNFVAPPPPLPSPFLVFSDRKSSLPLCPPLLIIAISTPSVYFFHHVSSKTLVGSLFLPEIPLAGNTIEPSPENKSCNIYELKNGDNSTLIVSVQFPVSAERSNLVAKLLIGGQIIPDRVLILDSVQSRNFRGKLSPDETYAFKLETSAERRSTSDAQGGSPLLKGVDYFPSGSMVDGLAAALLARCQIRNIRGTLCVTWPEYGATVCTLNKTLLFKNALSGFELSFNEDDESEHAQFNRAKSRHYDSEMYT